MNIKSLYLIPFIAIATSCSNSSSPNLVVDTASLDTMIAPTEAPSEKRKTAILDSLNKVYQKKGFDSFCDVVKEDEILYIKAAALADQQYANDYDNMDRMKLELSTYKKYKAVWLKEKGINRKYFEKDYLTVSLDLGSPCSLINKPDVEAARREILGNLGLSSY